MVVEPQTPKSQPEKSQSQPAAPKDRPALASLLKQRAEIDDQITEGYHRNKSFLAIDVEKSSEIKKGKSKDDTFLTFDAYHEMVKTAVESAGGQVHDTAGDGIMCAFDTADAACAAAIGILAALPDFNKDKNRLQSPLILRMGINSGRVLFDPARSLGELFDAVIDAAGHLQKEGSGDDILITQSTYDELSDKSRFVKDKIWESRQTQIYRYGESAAEADEKDMEKAVVVMDAISGKSFRDLAPGELVWVKRARDVFAESKIIRLEPEGELIKMVVELPDGKPAIARFRTALRLCVIFSKAEALAKKTMTNPEIERYTGAVRSPDAPGGISITPEMIWAGGALVVFILLILIVAALA